MGIATLNELFFTSAAAVRRPDRCLTRRERLSTDELTLRVRRLSATLALLGVKPGDRVAILSYNRPEWAVADFAILTAGAVVVPIYTTLPRDSVAYILKDSGARVAFVEDAAQAEKVSGLDHVIGFHGAGPGLLSFGECLNRGMSATEQEHRRRADAVKPDDLATVIYTSGTTGIPKGVMLSHANIASNVEAVTKILQLGPDDLALSFLPLSHIFERMVDYVYFYRGASIAYAASIDAVADDLTFFKPTIIASVPRFLEKVYQRVHKGVAAAPESRRRLFENAMKAASEPPGGFWRSAKRAWYDMLVHSKIRARLGGRLRVVISGGAALAPEIALFFGRIGIPVLQGYGLTETSPVITMNGESVNRAGTVGKPIPGVEVKLADDGEILTRGPHVMRGYYNKPDETAQVLRDGWFATGDIGAFDADGFLRITDRKKDLFKTSGGKYICPQPIENRLKEDPLISQAVVVGDGRKYAVALIVANRGETDVRPRVEAVVARVNETLAPYETIKKFALLESEFTIESGELTPTLKVRRRLIEERHRSIIDSLYAGDP